MEINGLMRSVLQAAIEGKLTKQLPEDGDARDLVKQIKEEKDKLIKEGKLKREKSLPEIKEEEIPFEIPENWCWVRLGEVTNIILGQSPNSGDINEDKKGIEFHQGKIFFSDKYIGVSNKYCTRSSKIAPINSILMCVRAPVGIVNFTDRELIIGRGLSSIDGIIVSNEFVYNFLLTMKSKLEKKSTGSTFKAINGDIIKEILIPIPSLAEQKRIVEKLDELLNINRKIN